MENRLESLPRKYQRTRDSTRKRLYIPNSPPRPKKDFKSNEQLRQEGLIPKEEMPEETKHQLEGFQFPNKTTPQPSTADEPPITTSNSFKLLEKVDDPPTTSNSSKLLEKADDPEEETIQIMELDEERKQPRPPPIRVQTMPDDLQKFHRDANRLCSAGCNLIYKNKEIIIKTKTEADHKKVTSGLKQTGYDFYTHRLKTDRTKRMVVKAAPFTNPEELKQHFLDNNVKVTDCIKLKGKSEYSASFLLNFQKEQDMDKVQQIRDMDHVMLRYQHYSRKEQYTQCRKCQQYGHGSSHCNRPAKCLKCAEDHITAECQKTKQTPATCANCKGDHPANYKGCIAYLDYVTNIQKRTGEKTLKTATQQTPTPRTIPTTTFRTTVPSFSYSQAVNSNKETPETSENNPPITDKFQTLHDTLNKINSLCNINLLIDIANDLLHIVETITDNVDRVMALASLKVKYQAK